ncbi:hypothetical protein EPUS_04458 [Endocarpon pusillum Z07020]|uniref:DUF202 domain-containing protein n=1 Tax=Endocarpon pusillum (strain Z07020 / HMAS-L-300199) TaxID=1263415 RepID=U1GW03_ENDPU|nr:uncharacterized protein EPUS_04458 [Endocarpon pusillum Z07020]ERF76638.1 hypothetical protein EPUS_04458 [Endocarpon pusillum Z07020]
MFTVSQASHSIFISSAIVELIGFSPHNKTRHPQDIYTYPRPDPRTGRLHRARSALLTDPELVELRAAQRTFEGAYIRTSLSQFSFALVVLKIFTAEFYSIGALFAVYGAGVLAVGGYRRREGNRQFFVVIKEERKRGPDDGVGVLGEQQEEHEGEVGTLQTEKRFRTSGNVVVVLTILSVMAYATLLVLTLRLGDTE